MLINQPENPTPKQLRSAINKKTYPSPHTLEFIAFTLVSKQSKLMGSAHQRFLLLDTKQKTLQYYSKIPDPLPTPGELGQFKESIKIKQSRSFVFKSTRTNIGKVKVEWIDQKGVKKEWVITFTSNQLMNQWILMVNQVIKDGHHHPENRPKSKVKQNQVDVSKYITTFMKQTGGGGPSPQSSQISKVPFWMERKQETSKFKNKTDESWILSQVAAKERESYSIQKSHQKIQNQQQKPQMIVQLKKEADQSIKKSKEQQKSSLNDNFIKIEEENGKTEVQNTGAAKNDQIKQVENPLTITFKKQQQQIKKELKKVQRQFIEEKPTKPKLEKIAQQKLQIQNLSIKKKRPSNRPRWINVQKNYEITYIQFVSQCQQLCNQLVQNYKTLAQKAHHNPTNSLEWQKQSSSLIVNRQQTQFKISSSAHLKWWQNDLKMKQFSSIVHFIRSKKTPPGYTAVFPLPVCAFMYKWKHIFCKVKIPQEFQPVPRSEGLDRFYNEIPCGNWKYYEFDGCLIIDFDSKSFQIDSTVDNKKIKEILKALSRNQYSLNSLSDLIEDLKFQNNVVLDDSLLSKMLTSGQLSQNNSNILRSFLIGIRCSSIIKQKLQSKVLEVAPVKILQAVDNFISSFTNMDEINPEIEKIFEYQLQQSQIYFNPSLIFTTILYCLGLKLEQIKTKTNLQHKKPQYSLKFKNVMYCLMADCLKQQLREISKLIKDHENEENEEKKIKIYEQFNENIQNYEGIWRKLMMKNEEMKKLYGMRYLNLQSRIKLIQSIYQQYIPSQISQGHVQKVIQIEQLIDQKPPSYWSYMISINCVKWMIKRGNSHQYIIEMLNKQIERCRMWTGAYNVYLQFFYELYAMYGKIIFDFKIAIQYGRSCLEHVIEVYGQTSAEAVEKWYQLGNIMADCELFEGALQAYYRASDLLVGEDDLALTMSGSRSSLRSDRIGHRKKSAQLMISLKMAKMQLALGEMEACLNTCSKSLNLEEYLKLDDPEIELQTLGLVVRCYEIQKEQNKLIQIIHVISTQFSYPSRLEEETQLQMIQKMLKICLTPYVRALKMDKQRRKFLIKIVQQIERKYKGRYTKKDYHFFLKEQCSKNGQILCQFADILQKVPMFYPGQQQNSSIHSDYKIFDDQQFKTKMYSPSQPKLLLNIKKLLQAFGGILGFPYLKNSLHY